MVPQERPLHVVTFVTRTGGRCYFATEGRTGPDGSVEPLRLPPQVQAQLDALEARVAWWVQRGPPALRVRGEAADLAAAIDAPDSLDRLVFL